MDAIRPQRLLLLDHHQAAGNPGQRQHQGLDAEGETKRDDEAFGLLPERDAGKAFAPRNLTLYRVCGAQAAPGRQKRDNGKYKTGHNRALETQCIAPLVRIGLFHLHHPLADSSASFPRPGPDHCLTVAISLSPGLPVYTECY